MIRTLAVIAVISAGCFHPQYDPLLFCGPGGACPSGSRCVNDLCVSGAPPGDGGPDGGPGDDGSNGGCTSFATLVNTCRLSFEADLVLNGSASYDTDAHVLMIGGTATPFAVLTVQLGSDQFDVISAHDVHLEQSATLRATGSHGLAIIASHDFLIDTDAQIDVSKGGAGARTTCPNGATPGGNNGNGAGGGGGGGFGGAGGSGGDGNHDGSPGQGGSQGKAEPSFPIGFHGGCPGADGGTGSLIPGGTGGPGGGALYLVAAGRMVFTSSAPLDAGGAGGRGGGHSGNNGDAGGGGGGSGGLLILEAPQILASGATIAANGGGGGEGSDRNGGGGNGLPGAVGTGPATGGSGGADSGSDGGNGGSAAGPAGQSVTAATDDGGGGGGGGVGFIRIFAPNAMFFAVSPMPG
jgi:hypothetical protein